MNSKNQEEILSKYQVLQTARVQLKKEFIGIDKVIDEAVNAISSWYLFPNLQEKPVIINLWGLTGVGKSSLIRRLVEIIEFEKRSYEFDLGENSEKIMKSTFEDISDELMGKPMVLTFDEFQYARTLSEDGIEIKNSYSRIIWQLFDNGRFPLIEFNLRTPKIFDLIKDLDYLVNRGVRVRNGKVIEQNRVFFDYFNSATYFRDKPEYDPAVDQFFIQPKYHDLITEVAPEKYKSIYDVENHLLKLDEIESIKFLEGVLELSLKPRIIDCSKSLIFILGNLDEAYKMSTNYNPDMDADEFHEQSLKISVVKIKKALKERFRNEQIARLGNTHIIYPAFSTQSFFKIIEMELDKIAKHFWNDQKLALSFDESVKNLIYQEGVFPAQGTRPVYSTIHNMINTRLGRIAIEAILKNISARDVLITYDNEQLIIDFTEAQEVVHSISSPIELELGRLRKNKKDDMQAIVAVHEAGHAIISCVLLKTVPEVVFSNTADLESNGYVYTKIKWSYVSRKEIQKRLAFYLGGYCAEKIIFGAENVTTGSENDIYEATSFITSMLKKYGMGQAIGAFQNPQVLTNEYVYNSTVNEEARNALGEALILAEEILEKQKYLLLKMADFLSDERTMAKDTIRDFLVKFAVDFKVDELIENGDLLFYRKHLKKQVNELIESSIESYEIKLNRI